MTKKMSSIPISWNTKRKIEKIKFDLETKLEKKLTWDAFFNKAKLITNNNDKEGKHND